MQRSITKMQVTATTLATHSLNVVPTDIDVQSVYLEELLQRPIKAFSIDLRLLESLADNEWKVPKGVRFHNA